MVFQVWLFPLEIIRKITTPPSLFFITFKMPLMCILAIISDVKSIVTQMSTAKVIHCIGTILSKVLGVLQLTDAKLNNAHVLISLRTHL